MMIFLPHFRHADYYTLISYATLDIRLFHDTRAIYAATLLTPRMATFCRYYDKAAAVAGS